MIVDAYSHTGLPRFQSVATYRDLMARHAIDRAVLSSFDSSPDLVGIHAAFTRWPDQFRGLGVPLGRDRSEMAAMIAAQLAAGFSGLRLTDADISERGWLLDMLAQERRVAVVCGQVTRPECARALLDQLERHDGLTVVGGHFAGVAEPQRLKDGTVAALFDHPRFSVVFSRQGAHQAALVRAWAEAVVVRTGWQRLMWGAEAPVLFWRNEALPQALAWIDQLQPSAAERMAFLGGNAARLYFSRPVQSRPLQLPFDPWARARPFPATLWMHGLPVDQALAGRLVEDWQARGGEGTLGTHLVALLERTLPPLA